MSGKREVHCIESLDFEIALWKLTIIDDRRFNSLELKIDYGG